MIFLMLSFFQLQNAFSMNCNYETSQTPIHMGGGFIDYEPYLAQKMEQKGFRFIDFSNPSQSTDVEVGGLADVSLQVYQQGMFEHVAAQATYYDRASKDYATMKEDSRCVMTQLCTNQDGARAVKKVIDRLTKFLPQCQ